MAVSQHQAGMIQTAFALDSTAVSQIPRSREILKALGDRVSADRERNILIKRNRALSLNEASVRTMLVRRRITGSAALDARTIEEIFRGVRRHANLVFRLSKKGGVG